MHYETEEAAKQAQGDCERDEARLAGDFSFPSQRASLVGKSFWVLEDFEDAARLSFRTFWGELQ